MLSAGRGVVNLVMVGAQVRCPTVGDLVMYRGSVYRILASKPDQDGPLFRLQGLPYTLVDYRDVRLLRQNESSHSSQRDGAKTRLRVRDDRYSSIGRKGGETVKQRYGSEHYSQIGRIGGLARKKKRNGVS